MYLLNLVPTSAIALTAIAHPNPHGTCPRQTGPEGVRVRLPPTFNTTSHNHHARPWLAPPVGWYFKPWNMMLASNAQYAAFRNLQYDPTAVDPSDPTGLVEDLFSFQLPGNDSIITTFGIDTPHPYFSNVLYYAATGVIEGATSEYSMIAWGCDAQGVTYYASYSTAAELTSTPAGIDLMSTSDEGLDQATIEAVVRALKRLGNEEITGLVESLTMMVQDGGRRGMPRVSLRLYPWGGRVDANVV
jgi:flavin-binding protein dodecin